ncbi:hypothetical protein GN109_05800 [Collimonas pratensis]|uniref:class I SAM-dependent methyltransferase n=1 Tax=Collimonas pratensis TaxID=279113 RepID=UPI00143D8562|nr:class I SAM-dependent methyltransferase [Collimonas pratensis]NKI68927.1 hypothetical protein [Collimonas pratensis]
MQSIGGVPIGKTNSAFQFDYSPFEVIADIVASGCIPDQKSHQYYPTPSSIGEVAIELAQIGANDTCLEPSAGQGGLANLMPKDRTRCIEISEMHCKILSAKGFDATQADFTLWSERTADRFDRVVMNPPFSEGRWQQHLAIAAGLVKNGGRLVAILPASAKGKDLLPGWALEFTDAYAGEFVGTSVSVVIAHGNKP